jgi:hypothetical protein
MTKGTIVTTCSARRHPHDSVLELHLAPATLKEFLFSLTPNGKPSSSLNPMRQIPVEQLA